MFFFQTIDVATDSDLQCMFRITYLKSNIDKVGCNDSYFESKLDVVIFYIIENSFGYYNCWPEDNNIYDYNNKNHRIRGRTVSI